MIEQVPTASGVTRAPLIEQMLGVLLCSVTGRFDVALAVKFCGLSMSFIFVGCANESVCDNPSTTKDLVTLDAAE